MSGHLPPGWFEVAPALLQALVKLNAGTTAVLRSLGVDPQEITLNAWVGGGEDERIAMSTTMADLLAEARSAIAAGQALRMAASDG